MSSVVSFCLRKSDASEMLSDSGFYLFTPEYIIVYLLDFVQDYHNPAPGAECDKR